MSTCVLLELLVEAARPPRLRGRARRRTPSAPRSRRSRSRPLARGERRSDRCSSVRVSPSAVPGKRLTSLYIVVFWPSGGSCCPRVPREARVPAVDGEQVEVEVSLMLLAGQAVRDGRGRAPRGPSPRGRSSSRPGATPGATSTREGRAVTALAADLDDGRPESGARGRDRLASRDWWRPPRASRGAWTRSRRTRLWRGAGIACTLLAEELVKE